MLILGVLLVTKVFSQNTIDKSKAEASVKKHMIKANNYKPISFGEFFEQPNSKEIQDKLKTKKSIKYSLVHTYSLGHDTTVNMYFHLDEKYIIVGKLSYKEMEGIMLEGSKHALDSIMNSFIPK